MWVDARDRGASALGLFPEDVYAVQFDEAASKKLVEELSLEDLTRCIRAGHLVSTGPWNGPTPKLVP